MLTKEQGIFSQELHFPTRSEHFLTSRSPTPGDAPMPDPTAPRSRSGPPALTQRAILGAWWPLAASWLMMGFELPAVSATMARLPDPEISLAAYGGVVFPLALLIEAPIIMLLAASTELSRDRIRYRQLHRFMVAAAVALTGVHLVIPLTPLFDLIVGSWLNVPEQIREPARVGLLIMTPWTASIAYRRFQQGVLIRFGRSRTVGVGTAVRLATNVLVLFVGWVTGAASGIVVGTTAIAAGVTIEAVFVGFAVRPALKHDLPDVDPRAKRLDIPRFLRFYVPLAMTPLLGLLALPIGSAAISRMPHALESLAVWPVINGLTFTLRSLGFAFNEVVVSRLAGPRTVAPLFRFAGILAAATSMVLAIVAATPLSGFWFRTVSALSGDLAALAGNALWIPIIAPALSVFQSWYQGILVSTHRTRGITEAVALYLLVAGAVYGAGIAWSGGPGLYFGLGGMVAGMFVQTAWLAVRSRGALRVVERRGPDHDAS